MLPKCMEFMEIVYRRIFVLFMYFRMSVNGNLKYRYTFI